MGACNFVKKETLTQVLSYGFNEISKNNFFTEDLWATASMEFIKRCIFPCSLNYKLWYLFMITSISCLHFAHNIGHYYLFFSTDQYFQPWYKVYIYIYIYMFIFIYTYIFKYKPWYIKWKVHLEPFLYACNSKF